MPYLPTSPPSTPNSSSSTPFPLSPGDPPTPPPKPQPLPTTTASPTTRHPQPPLLPPRSTSQTPSSPSATPPRLFPLRRYPLYLHHHPSLPTSRVEVWPLKSASYNFIRRSRREWKGWSVDCGVRDGCGVLEGPVGWWREGVGGGIVRVAAGERGCGGMGGSRRGRGGCREGIGWMFRGSARGGRRGGCGRLWEEGSWGDGMEEWSAHLLTDLLPRAGVSVHYRNVSFLSLNGVPVWKSSNLAATRSVTPVLPHSTALQV